jgi:AraC family transcriptional regulator
MRRASGDPVSYGTRRFRSVTTGPFLLTDAWFAGKDVLPPHHHDRTVVGITLSGEWSSVVGRRTLTNRAGIVHTEPAGDTHSNHFGSRGAHVLIVKPDPGARELLTPCRSLLGEVRQLTPDGARTLAGRLVIEMSEPDDLSPMAIEAGCLDLLACASRAASDRPRTHPRWLARVEEFLRAEFRRAPTLEDVARIAGVHPSHLVREFKRAYGETPASHLRRLRIESTAPFVSGSDEALARIAGDAGFSDQSHFTRQFRRHFGVTPIAYRRAHRERSPLSRA